MTVTVEAKKNMTKISKQKQYWQKLADEYEKKIQLLKQAKASAQAQKQQSENKKAVQTTWNSKVGLWLMKYIELVSRETLIL